MPIKPDSDCADLLNVGEGKGEGTWCEVGIKMFQVAPKLPKRMLGLMGTDVEFLMKS